ncbi:hypothetical protein [Synechococcus sp. FACHB-909]|uniref:hypothetical protein n=1 Tax=Synechococcus sp. FACHB-909 TaxID=2692863 RepID=UPI00168986EC|nr:hypothetical protein [Synechococcus sp. FACHB-909]MBD2719502.1 hypothetical protein [Synechococcus sp. FACHB-909]
MTVDLSLITKVLYIKLGNKGDRESDCIAKNLCYIGFCSSDPDCFQLILEALRPSNNETKKEAWKRVRQFHKDRVSGTPQKCESEATKQVNQLREFFESGEKTLWVTFHARKLYYAVLDPAIQPRRSEEDGGSYRSVVDQWRCVDIEGNELLEDKLSGRITQTKSFRGTSCAVKDDVMDYLKRKIGCQPHSYRLVIDNAMAALQNGLSSAIKSLTPGDFELLVELIFSRTLRRISTTGKVLEFIDIAFENPLNGDLVSVQVKARTNPREFKRYMQSADRGVYDAFYWVFHSSGSTTLDDFYRELEPDDSTTTILDISRIASMAIEAGLVSWVIDKAG